MGELGGAVGTVVAAGGVAAGVSVGGGVAAAGVGEPSEDAAAVTVGEAVSVTETDVLAAAAGLAAASGSGCAQAETTMPAANNAPSVRLRTRRIARLPYPPPHATADSPDDQRCDGRCRYLVLPTGSLLRLGGCSVAEALCDRREVLVELGVALGRAVLRGAHVSVA